MNPLALAGGVLGGTAFAQAAWWTLLSVVALPPHRSQPADDSGAGLAGGTVQPRIAVVVPAHNEEAAIAATVESLRAMTGAPVRIVVIADNCTDQTAAEARRAGADTVLERFSSMERGKSYALAFAIDFLRADPPDAVCFVDADTTVSPNFASAVADAIAGGEEAVQVHYRAAAGDSSLSALRRLAFLLIHWSRPLGARRLGLATSLKGNGMGLRWGIAAGGLTGSGVTEDAALSLDLAERGIPVAFVPSAWVEGLMATTYAAARTQDERWEGGRLALTRRATWTAVRVARRGRWRAASTAAEVASLPLSLAGVMAAGGGVLLLAGRAGVLAALLPGATLAAYVLTGLAAARPPVRDLAALREAPRFLVHKLGTYGRIARKGAPSEWVRTARD